MLPIRTILHPTDFSDCSEYAMRLARSLANDYGARLVAVHVAPTEIIDARLIGGPYDPTRRLLGLEARLREIFEQDYDTQAEVRVLEGDPAEAILREAEEVRADLIVMGRSGRSGLGRLLLGSVVEAVMRQAHCPVLTVRGPVEIAAQSASPVSAQA
jgi:nucleotide-binding universal stress UspA family protein